MENPKVEIYCCTCGVDKKGESSGNNPTTMCHECRDEVANFCITCRKSLSGQSMTLCPFCYTKMKKNQEIEIK